MATITSGTAGLDMRVDFLPDISTASGTVQSATEVDLTGGFSGFGYTFLGSGFSGDDGTGFPTAGTINSLTISDTSSNLLVSISGINLSVVHFGNFEASGDYHQFQHAVLKHADTITGSNADDYLLGLGGGDTIYGGAGHDVLQGDQGDDLLYGGNDRDTLLGGPGDDTLDGGAGYDTVNYARHGAGVTVDLSITTAQDTGQGLDTLVSIENVTGTDSGDDLKDDSHNNVLKGRGDSDFLDISRGGRDAAYGGDGDDYFTAKGKLTANDKIDGGDGNDRVQLFGDYTGAHALVFNATTMVNVETLQLLNHGLGFPHLPYDLTSDDATVASGATLTVDASVGGPGQTSVSFDGSAETDGCFVFIGNVANDTFIGGAQADSFSGGVGADLLTGGDGADTFNYVLHDSSGSFWGYDTITDFNTFFDFFHFPTLVTTLNAVSGTVDGDTNLDGSMGLVINDNLVAQGAVVVTATGGESDGHIFLVVDGDGNTTYDGGTDYIVDVTGYSGVLSTGNFI